MRSEVEAPVRLPLSCLQLLQRIQPARNSLLLLDDGCQHAVYGI
jgi:hypothetical protein